MNPQQKLSLRAIHLALVAGILIFAGTVFYLKSTSLATTGSDLDDGILFLVAGAAAGAGLLMSRILGTYIFFQRVRVTELSARKMASLSDEEQANVASAYTSSKIIEWALLEGPAMLLVVTYLIGDQILGLFGGLALAAWLFLQSPSEQQLDRRLSRQN